jgi:hypothetical protein
MTDDSFVPEIHPKKEWRFWFVVFVLGVIACFIAPYPQYAMWFGFAVAGYSAIANDSIQTLGTFLSSNKNIHWGWLWLFIGGLLVVTHTYGWFVDGGDIAFERLSKIPQPESFTFLQMLAPIMLVILTRYKMPVSTTFFILSVFSGVVIIKKMLLKTLLGYGVAFIVALLMWAGIAKLQEKEFFKKNYSTKGWRVIQALSTSFLWFIWITHDTANVAVFLPRVLDVSQMMMAIGFLFLVVGLIMFRRGGEMQSIVTEKTDVVDVRAATMIDIIYAFVLLYFKEVNTIPMSTTWVFLGLLAGREFALSKLSEHPRKYVKTLKLVGKDIGRAGFGLLVSLILAFLIMS